MIKAKGLYSVTSMTLLFMASGMTKETWRLRRSVLVVINSRT